MNYFFVDIYTPSKIAGRNLQASALIIPTIRGDIQVLPEHTHLITKIEIGILKLQQNGQEKSYLIGPGICKILGKTVLILTKQCERAEEVKIDVTKENLNKYQKELMGGASLTEERFFELQQKVKLEEARLKLVSKM